MPETVQLSVVIPVFNEQDNLEPLLAELVPVLDGLGLGWEVLCVDDASTDASGAVLARLAAGEPRLRVLTHRINSGESAGQASGFRHARGELVLTMDADLQNDPADIPRYLAALGPGIDAVCGYRAERREGWLRRFASRTANRFRAAITGDRLRDAGCTFRLLRRKALAEIPVFNGMHRFLPTLIKAQGGTVVEIAINDRPRRAGVSKYGIHNRLWRGLADCFAVRWYQRRALRADRLLDA
ncbi:MAG: glycosyltransferase family 2 protein [Immundisolibacter sp.]